MLPCGHHESNMVETVESKTKFCRQCDIESRCRDAETREKELFEENRSLRATVSTLTAELIRLAAPSVPDAVRADLDRLRKCSEFGGDTPAYCVFSDGEEFRDTLMRVCRAILSARGAGDGWRPIETAPQTGRTILLGFRNECGKWRTMRGQWMSDEYIAEMFEEPDGHESGWYETTVEADEPPNCWETNPTHWMPLPNQPLGIAAESAKEMK